MGSSIIRVFKNQIFRKSRTQEHFFVTEARRLVNFAEIRQNFNSEFELFPKGFRRSSLDSSRRFQALDLLFFRAFHPLVIVLIDVAGEEFLVDLQQEFFSNIQSLLVLLALLN